MSVKEAEARVVDPKMVKIRKVGLKLGAGKDQVLVIEDRSKDDERKTEGGVIIQAGAEMANWHEGLVVSSAVAGIFVGDTVFWGGDPFSFKYQGEEYVSLMDFEVRAVVQASV